MTTIKIETYLPQFPGFYNTIYDMDTDTEIYNLNQDRDEDLPELVYDDFTMDYEEYTNKVSKEYTKAIEAILKDICMVNSIKFQTLISPKYYNYETDSINVEINLTEENQNKIREYINTNLDDFKEYLKEKYTLRDGFIPSYSNDYDVWEKETNNFSFTKDNVHELGSVLNFILLDIETESMDVYYNTMKNVCVGEYFYIDE